MSNFTKNPNTIVVVKTTRSIELASALAIAPPHRDEVTVEIQARDQRSYSPVQLAAGAHGELGCS